MINFECTTIQIKSVVKSQDLGDEVLLYRSVNSHIDQPKAAKLVHHINSHMLQPKTIS